MPHSRFTLDDERLFPDHAHAPGHEPRPTDTAEAEAGPILGPAELARFAGAALLLLAGLGLISALLMRA